MTYHRRNPTQRITRAEAKALQVARNCHNIFREGIKQEIARMEKEIRSKRRETPNSGMEIEYLAWFPDPGLETHKFSE